MRVKVVNYVFEYTLPTNATINIDPLKKRNLAGTSSLNDEEELRKKKQETKQMTIKPQNTQKRQNIKKNLKNEMNLFLKLGDIIITCVLTHILKFGK